MKYLTLLACAAGLLATTACGDNPRDVARDQGAIAKDNAAIANQDANMAEKIAFHKLKPWHIKHEIFEALEWETVQEVFEQTAYLVASRDRCLEYCSDNNIELVKAGRSTKTIHHFDDFAL